MRISGLWRYAKWKVRASRNRETTVPRREPRVSERLPSLSTSHSPRKVPRKFMEEVAADSHIARELSVTPAMEMMEAL